MSERTFTYDKFQQDGNLTLLDPLFTIIVIFSALLLFAVYKFTPPAKVMLFVAAFTLIVSAQLVTIGGILADELNLGGSSKNTTLFIITCVLQVAVIILAFYREKKHRTVIKK